MKKRVRRLLMVLCAAVFLVSSWMLLRDMLRSSRERGINSALTQQVRQVREEIKAAAPPAADRSNLPEPPSPYAESGILRQYDPLWQQNNDLSGWLWIEETDIDYPVMYTPKRPEKYLRQNFYGKWAASGSLFIGEGSGPDAPLVMVYGHHMRDGSMFGQLDKYQSEEYAKEHPIIHLDTLTEEREYEVVAAFRSRVYQVDEKGVFRYYRYADLSDPEEFARYLEAVKSAALYDTGVEPQFGQRILVLSTCSYHTQNGRFVVVARQITPEAEEAS